MRMLVALAALVAAGTPNVTKLVLQPSQVGPGYVLFKMAGGSQVKNSVTLNLCGLTGYPSEARRIARYQVTYLKRKGAFRISNEIVVYRPGGATQAVREAAHHADTCPDRAIDSGQPGVGPVRFTIARLTDRKLLPGYLAVRVRARGTIGGKTFDQISYAVYQRRGNVLSGTYSDAIAGANPQTQLKLLLHAAEQSALNLRLGHNVASPTA